MPRESRHRVVQPNDRQRARQPYIRNAECDAPSELTDGEDVSLALARQMQLEDIQQSRTQLGQLEIPLDEAVQAALDRYTVSLKDRLLAQQLAIADDETYDSLMSDMNAEEPTADQTALPEHFTSKGSFTSSSTDVVMHDADSRSDAATSYRPSYTTSSRSRHAQHGRSEHRSANTMTAQSITSQAVPTLNCCCCLEHFPRLDVTRAPCGDFYCRDCLNTLFLNASRDETQYPPRCHNQRIRFETVQERLSPDIAAAFTAKAPEFETSTRVYCHIATCSTWIPPDMIRADEAICPDCFAMTCVHCKAAMHDKECAEDTDTQAVIEAADDKGWQRCYQCRTLVDRHVGCNHITCTCGAHFCYICGEPWQTCCCPLYATKRRVFDRQSRTQQQSQTRQLSNVPISDQQFEPTRVPSLRSESLFRLLADTSEGFTSHTPPAAARYRPDLEQSAAASNGNVGNGRRVVSYGRESHIDRGGGARVYRGHHARNVDDFPGNGYF